MFYLRGMEHKIIAIDLDDVIVMTAPLVLSHYNKTYGTNLQLKDAYSRDLKIWGVKRASDAIARVEEYLKTEEFKNQPPLKEAILTTKRLSKKFEMHIVTGRTEFLSEATEAMLQRYFRGVFRSVEFTGFFGSKARSKADVCKELNADLLIDDHLFHAEVVAKAGIDVLLFGNYPWNQADNLPANITRVKGWNEIENLLTH
jgi:5'(3')-deoxyribonucleotidase